MATVYITHWPNPTWLGKMLTYAAHAILSTWLLRTYSYCALWWSFISGTNAFTLCTHCKRSIHTPLPQTSSSPVLLFCSKSLTIQLNLSSCPWIHVDLAISWTKVDKQIYNLKSCPLGRIPSPLPLGLYSTGAVKLNHILLVDAAISLRRIYKRSPSNLLFGQLVPRNSWWDLWCELRVKKSCRRRCQTSLSHLIMQCTAPSGHGPDIWWWQDPGHTPTLWRGG